MNAERGRRHQPPIEAGLGDDAFLVEQPDTAAHAGNSLVDSCHLFLPRSVSRAERPGAHFLRLNQWESANADYLNQQTRHMLRSKKTITRGRQPNGIISDTGLFSARSMSCGA